MVTYLAALRFAPNVERVLTELQRRRFATIGDDGARFLPALIPLAWVSTCPSAAVLDRYRRSHAVRLPGAPPPDGPTQTSDAPPPHGLPPAVIRLDIGFVGNRGVGPPRRKPHPGGQGCCDVFATGGNLSFVGRWDLGCVAHTTSGHGGVMVVSLPYRDGTGCLPGGRRCTGRTGGVRMVAPRPVDGGLSSSSGQPDGVTRAPIAATRHPRRCGPGCAPPPWRGTTPHRRPHSARRRYRTRDTRRYRN